VQDIIKHVYTQKWEKRHKTLLLITRLLLSPMAKELWKSVNIWQSYGSCTVSCFFDSCGTLFWILAWPSLVVFVDGDFSLIILHIAGKLRMRHVTWRVISWSKRNTYKHIPCPWFWIFIYRNGHVKILWWLIYWLLEIHDAHFTTHYSWHVGGFKESTLVA